MSKEKHGSGVLAQENLLSSYTLKCWEMPLSNKIEVMFIIYLYAEKEK